MKSVFTSVQKFRPINKAANLGAGNHSGAHWESGPKSVGADVLSLLSDWPRAKSNRTKEWSMSVESLEKILILTCSDVDGIAVGFTAAGCFAGIQKAFPLRYLESFTSRKDCWPLLCEYCDRNHAACAAVLLGRRLKKPVAKGVAELVTESDLNRFFSDFNM